MSITSAACGGREGSEGGPKDSGATDATSMGDGTSTVDAGPLITDGGAVDDAPSFVAPYGTPAWPPPDEDVVSIEPPYGAAPGGGGPGR